MGFFDSWSDLVAAATPWTAVEAEAVSADAESAPAAVAETKVRWLLLSPSIEIWRVENGDGLGLL